MSLCNSPLNKKLTSQVSKKSNSPPKDYKHLIEELNSQIEQYEHKALNTIQYHEKDFLIAYQDHMQKVYKDLDRLKDKVSE